MHAKALLNRLLPPASFARNVGVLAGGTAFGQAIAVLALPVLTRLYTPADFSALAVYAAVLSIVSVIACLRLEIAIPLPKEDGTAINLLILGLISSTAIATATGVVLLLFPDIISSLLKQPKLRPYFWMLPLGIWLAGIYSAIQFWSTRQKRFAAVARTRMTQSIGSTGVQVSLGLLGNFGLFGLLLGQMMTSGIGIFKLGYTAWRDIKGKLAISGRESIKKTLADYNRFPKYSTFEAFANIAAIQVPVIIIGAAALGPEAGFLLLATKAASIPMGLLGGAIAQVYLSAAPDERRAGRLSQFTTKILARLIALGIGPLVALGIVAPSAVPLVLGSEWARAGVVVSWLIPWLCMQFLASPVSMALHVTGNQRLALITQIIGVVLRIGATAVAAQFFTSYLVEIYAISGLVFYLGYLLVILYVCRISINDLAQSNKKGLLVIGVWCLAGMAVKLILDFGISQFIVGA